MGKGMLLGAGTGAASFLYFGGYGAGANAAPRMTQETGMVAFGMLGLAGLLFKSKAVTTVGVGGLAGAGAAYLQAHVGTR